MPTATPDPASVVYSDEYILIALEDNQYDAVIATQRFRVYPQDRRYAVVTKASEAPSDGREAIILTDSLTDVCVRADRSYRQNRFTHTRTALPDGTVEVIASGFVAQSSYYAFHEFTYAQPSGQKTTARYSHTFQTPAAPERSLSLVIDGDKPQYFSPHNSMALWFEDYSYVNVRFSYSDVLPRNAELRLTAINGVPGEYGSAPLEINSDNLDSDLRIARIRMDKLPDDAAFFTFEVWSSSRSKPTLTFTLKAEGARQTAPTPTAEPAPVAEAFEAPEDMTLLAETDWYAVYRGESWFDGHMCGVQVLLLPKDPARYVLAMDGVSADPDGRTALPVTMTLAAFNDANLKERLTALTISATPADKGGLLLDCTGFPLVNSRSIIHLQGECALVTPDGQHSAVSQTFKLQKPTYINGFAATNQYHLQKPRTGVAGVSIVQGALYVTDSHCYIRFTYDTTTAR